MNEPIEVIELAQGMFEKFIAHSSTFNSNHDAIHVLEATLDYAWCALCLLDHGINSYVK